MSELNAIGLNKVKSENVANKLTKLLANYSIFYHNVRGYHRKIKG